MTPESILAWLAAREPRPPRSFDRRLGAIVEQADAACMRASVAETLAAVASVTLERVLELPPDRATATDLLVADALITYAMEAQASEDVERLDEFATHVGTM